MWVHMQFFDYDADLSSFNTLMEDIEDSVPLMDIDDDERVIHLEARKASTAKKPTSSVDKFTGAMVASAIRQAMADPKIIGHVFNDAYWPKDKKPFVLADKDGCKIINDPLATKIIDKQSDKKIVVNFSLLVNKNTSANFAKEVQSIGSWDKMQQDQFGPYHEAIIKALKKLQTVANAYFKDPESDKNSLDKPKKEKNPDELNKSAPDDGQQQDQQQQNPQEQQNPQQQDQNPQDDNVPPPEDDGPVDQRAVLKEILEDFRDSYQQPLQAECDEQKDTLDDEGKEALVDQVTQSLLKPYQDKADQDTKTKVRQVVAYNIRQYTQNPNGEQNQQPDEDDMDWSPKDNKTEPDNGDNNNNNKPKEPSKSIGQRFHGIMSGLKNAGVINTELHHYPTFKRAEEAEAKRDQAKEAAKKKKQEALAKQKAMGQNTKQKKKDEFQF